MDINSLRRICRENKITWTLHALSRIRMRKIASDEIIDTVINGKVIKFYHDDKPFPSWLLYNNNPENPIHAVASTDGEKVFIITAYVPTLIEWQSDFITRKVE